jgi:hypothetical protein
LVVGAAYWWAQQQSPHIKLLMDPQVFFCLHLRRSEPRRSQPFKILELAPCVADSSFLSACSYRLRVAELHGGFLVRFG